MLSPPTICLGGDCQRHCDNFCRIQFDHDNTSLYYFDMYEIGSHNIKGIRSPLKQVKSHTKAPSAETRLVRGERCILNLYQQCHNFLSVCDPMLSEAERKEHDKRMWD